MDIIKKDNFKYNKAYGQNFLTDVELLRGIVVDSGVKKGDNVLEIGTGEAALTLPLSEIAGRIVTYEIDERLKDILKVKFFNVPNVELVLGDYLKRTEEKVTAPYKVVANLPYYITTPIIFDLIEGNNRPESITVMVQKEVAERLTAPAGAPAYGAVTAVVRLYGEAKLMRIVPAEKFTPKPKVDSAVIRIDRTDTFQNADYRRTARAIKAGFAMRRKTLVNNVAAAYAITKEEAKTILAHLGISELARGETLATEDYVRLGQAMYEFRQNADNTHGEPQRNIEE